MTVSCPAPLVVRVAVPVPVRTAFDYQWPTDAGTPVPGLRVWVPFGRRQLIGVVLELPAPAAVPVRQLKTVAAVLDQIPVLGEADLTLLRWAADYYQHPLGEVLDAALPARLRHGKPTAPAVPEQYALTANGRDLDLADLHRAPLQARLMAQLKAGGPLAGAALAPIGASWRTALGRLVERGWVEVITDPVARAALPAAPSTCLNTAQAVAVRAVLDAAGRYAGFVLHGVTGSGKTEVYLRIAETLAERGRQSLILVPEIALTPQLVARFRTRLGDRIACLHSGLGDLERHRAWWRARRGDAAVVLGTRSAVFTPLACPGVILVDEEHDGSYKQQDGFRYHARDLAVKRASLLGVPVVLGSATPSLETVENIHRTRYRRLTLAGRAGGAALPAVRLVDLARTAAEEGLAPPLLAAIERRLAAGEQSLVFINRRGFAPFVVCYQCGWRADCGRCAARLILHRTAGRLRCHHCGADHPAPPACPACTNLTLYHGGFGTQRIAQALAGRFPAARLLRVDRDNVAGKGALERHLDQVHRGEVDILVGTQMLSKGHDFPNVTLVGILNVDQGLFSLDFRAPEQLFQQVMQVGGRSGRAAKPGEVLIQTRYPRNPYFALLRDHDFDGFAELALAERRAAGYPPFGYLAMLRAESTAAETPLAFLTAARTLGARHATASIELLDPLPAPMERKAGRYRAQLLVQASNRAHLQAFLGGWIGALGELPAARRVRWSIDIDPTDMY